MKKIICRKVFDTEKAKLIGTYSNVGRGASSKSDFKWYEESLYVTKYGQYFLYGVGGPMSRYQEQTGSSTWSGSEDIRLMDESEAYSFAQNNLDPDVVMKHFEVQEG